MPDVPPRHLPLLGVALVAGTAFLMGLVSGKWAAAPSDVRVEKPTAREVSLAEQVDRLRAAERANEATLEEARASIRRLLAQAAAVAATRPGLDWGRDENRADRAAVAAIVVPPDPTREQAREVVAQVRAASRGQQGYSPTDPQVEVLARLVPTRLDVLVESSVGDFYVDWAIDRAVAESQKPAVIAALRRRPQLVDVVRSHHWEPDAKDVLVAGMRGGPRYVPTGWVDAVADLRDPTTYPLLRAYLADGANPSWTYKAIAGLPGIDLDEWVRYGWGRRKPGLLGLVGFGPDVDFAPIAAAHGHKDAVAALAKALSDPAAKDWQRESARKGLAEATAYDGDDSAAAGWYAAHKDQLRFDPAAKRFVLDPAGAATTRPSTGTSAAATPPASTSPASTSPIAPPP